MLCRKKKALSQLEEKIYQPYDINTAVEGSSEKLKID